MKYAWSYVATPLSQSLKNTVAARLREHVWWPRAMVDSSVIWSSWLAERRGMRCFLRNNISSGFVSSHLRIGPISDSVGLFSTPSRLIFFGAHKLPST
jgi:hypothetical protein